MPAHGDPVYRIDGSLAHDTETYVVHYLRQLLGIKFERGLHPTQKSVALFEYIIQTYTNRGEIVLDNCMGSETTAVGCINSGRNYTGFEWDKKHYQTAAKRVKNMRPSP